MPPFPHRSSRRSPPRGCSLACVLVGLVLLLGGAPPFSAQAQLTDSTELRQFQRADALLRSGEPDQAIDILEQLYNQSPDYGPFYRKLKDAYEQSKRYEDALRLLEDRIGDDPTPPLLSEKGRLLYQNGQPEAAMAAWEKALSLRPDAPATYRTVYRTLRNLQRYDQAIGIIENARATLDRPALFRSELAILYNRAGQHRNAMREYVALLEADPNRIGYVQERLRPFVGEGMGRSASIDVLRTIVEESPLNPTYRALLAWLLVEDGNYEAALDTYRALDRLQEQRGRRLYAFAQKAADADRYEVATTALESILDEHPDAPIAPSAQRALGDTYQRWAARATDRTIAPDTTGASGRRYAAARTAYNTFLEKYPDHDEVPAVLADLGTLDLDVYRRLDAAQATLERVIERAPKSHFARTAQLDLGRIALLRGEFSQARLLFSRLVDALRSGDLANRARFELARLHFYQNEFDAARSRAEGVAANTSVDAANDAIRLKGLIQENQGPDSLNVPLRLYAQAQFRERQRRYGDARLPLDSLLTAHPRHPLADDARFQRATLLLAEGDTAAAQSAFSEVPERHPRSPFADRSFFRLAALHEAQGRPEAAAATYDRLLTEYPQSLLAGDARARLRALRQRQRQG